MLYFRTAGARGLLRNWPQQCLNLFNKAFPPSSLPATFRDAISVTQKFGADYLWTDSLRIIQESAEDWKKESFEMMDYYRNAYLTISALESSGSEVGFCHPRDAGVEWPDRNRLWKRSRACDTGAIFRNAALNKRGWALQERLISTRIIHYTKEEMLWECLTCSARENTPIESRDVVDSYSLVSSEGQDFKRALLYINDDAFSRENGAFAL